MSYKYYMGSKSNIDTKTKSQPFVISMNTKTKNRIDSWLEFYHVDFDELIDSIKSVLGKEIRLIDYEKNNEFLVLLEDYSGVNLDLFYDSKTRPTFGIRFAENWYECVIGEDIIVEKMCEVENGIKYNIVYLPYSQMIVIAYYNVVIQIEFEGRDMDLYSKLRWEIPDLEDAGSLDGIFEWALKNVIGISKYIAISVTELGSMKAFRFEITENQISKYIRLNPFETFELLADGSWNVTVGNVEASYDADTGKQKYDVKKHSFVMVKNVDQVIPKINEAISAMWEKVELVNNNIEEILKNR